MNSFTTSPHDVSRADRLAPASRRSDEINVAQYGTQTVEARRLDATYQDVSAPAAAPSNLRRRRLTPDACNLLEAALKSPDYLPGPTTRESAEPSTSTIYIPPHLSRDAEFMTLYNALRHEGRQHRRCLPTVADGERFYNQSGQDVFRYTILANRSIQRMSIEDVAGTQRDPALLDSGRLCAILTAMLQNKRLPPIQVNEACELENGFHRYFASQLIGYTEINVERPGYNDSEE